MKTFGRVEAPERESVLKALEESYLRLQPHDLAYVELCLFESVAQMEAFHARERASLSMTIDAIVNLFVAQHDVWSGTPRISICLERLRALPDAVKLGNIRHEAGHSILHGSIEYYMMPPSIHTLTGKEGFSRGSAGSFLYLVSTAVKDFEVSRLLVAKGCFEDQVAYARDIIRTSGDEELAWRMSRGNRVAELLCIASRLKEVCCIAPLLGCPVLRGEFQERIVDSLSYLGSGIAGKFLLIARCELPKLGEDTMKNIDAVSGILQDQFLTG